MKFSQLKYFFFLFIIIFSCKKAIYKNYPQTAQLESSQYNNLCSEYSKIYPEVYDELPINIKEKIEAYLSSICSGKFKENLRFHALDVISDSSEINDIIVDTSYDDTLKYRRKINFPNEYFEVDTMAYYRFCFYTNYEVKGIAPFGISFSMDKNGEVLRYSNFSKHSFLNKDEKIIPISKVHEEIEKRNINPETVIIRLRYNERKNTLYWFIKKTLAPMGIGYGNCFGPSYTQFFKMDAIYGDIIEYDRFKEEEYFDYNV